MTSNSTFVDEETPLLSSPVDDQKKRQPTPLPKLQIAIIMLCQLCEPLISQSIYPYINQVSRFWCMCAHRASEKNLQNSLLVN